VRHTPARPSLAQGFLGILMLETRFPRPPGDIGNPETFARAGIPVRFAVVAGASPARIVQAADPNLLRPFVDAAVRLAAEGARIISTSCGFLARYQSDLAAAVRVPVWTSSLLECRRFTRPGIVTFDRVALGRAVLWAAGVADGTPVEGLDPGCELHRRILSNDDVLDLEAAERNVVAAARRLVARHPSVTDLVLECTNMPPYRDAVARATGRGVHDIETLLIQAWSALPP
jgi:hypothetical protein